MTVEEAMCSCREAGEADFEEIAELFHRSNHGLQEAASVRWKCFDNPGGPARILMLEDSAGSIIGIWVYLPRLFAKSGAETFHVRQSLDLFIAKEYREKRSHSKLRDYIYSIKGYSAVIGFSNKRSRGITRTLPGDSRTYYPVGNWFYPVFTGHLFRDKPYRFLASRADILARLYSFLWLKTAPRNLYVNPIGRFEKDYELDSDSLYGVVQPPT